MKYTLFFLLLTGFPIRSSAQTIARIDMIAMLNKLPATSASVADAHNKAKCTSSSCSGDALFAMFDTAWNSALKQIQLVNMYQDNPSDPSQSAASQSTGAPSKLVQLSNQTQDSITVLKLPSLDVAAQIDSVVYSVPLQIMSAEMTYNQQNPNDASNPKVMRSIRMKCVGQAISVTNSLLHQFGIVFGSDKSHVGKILSPLNSALMQSGYGTSLAASDRTDVATVQFHGIIAEQTLETTEKRMYSETAYLIVEQNQN